MADGSGHAFADAFLGVERSLTGRAWRLRPADAATARAHALREGLSEPMSRALASRGVGEAGLETFLRPTLKALFPDPSCFLDMDRAAEVIVDAVVAGRRCVVFADYDVDGAASGALLVRWFRALGAELPTYVPDRLLEGYGPSPAAFRRLKAEGAELVITVDCGAAAQEALEGAAEIGLPVVVIDHHLMRGDPPPAAALVNPTGPAAAPGRGRSRRRGWCSSSWRRSTARRAAAACSRPAGPSRTCVAGWTSRRWARSATSRSSRASTAPWPRWV